MEKDIIVQCFKIALQTNAIGSFDSHNRELFREFIKAFPNYKKEIAATAMQYFHEYRGADDDFYDEECFIERCLKDF